MVNHYIARKVGTDLYLGKRGVHKDAYLEWTEYPRFYPTKHGLIRSAKEKLKDTIQLNGVWTHITLPASDVEILEMDGPFNIVNIENLSTL